jgi:DNA-binding helix-hairpin-helix protein with protein kinase domain
MKHLAARAATKAPREVELGPVLAEGGEGRIHALPGRPGLVAKVYHDPPSAEKAKKLAAMVACRTDELARVAAWPVEILRATPGGAPIGLVLPRVDGHQDIHMLYGPRSRQSAFPLAGWPFLIRAAANLARAFASVHAHGHVVGDVNDRVALVSPHALVRLIDCDGFQVRHAGETFTCDVGVPTHQPPELQGRPSFRGLARSENHDAFGLAVLVFQLLFLARHPFSGSYGKAGPMPLERAIQEHRFVYGRAAAERGLAPPPAALELSIVTRDVARLFEQAFAPESVRGGRPRAAQWALALDELGRLVQRCRTNPSHAYLKGKGCPFCALDRQTDLALFHQPHATAGSRARTVPVHVPTLWKEIASIEAPPKAEPPPEGLLAFERQCLGAARGRPWRWTGRAALVGLSLALAWPTGGLSFALLFLLPRVIPCQRAPGGRVLERRARDWVRRWREKASEQVFHERRAELERARAELEGLDEEHARGTEALEHGRRSQQLRAYLRRQRIAEAVLPELDRSALAVLESYGLETADALEAAPLARANGLSEAVRRALLAWRARLEKRFVFDPSQGVSPEERAALERAIQKRRADLIQRLVDGPARLHNAAHKVQVARETLAKEVGPLVEELTRARRGV